jgi:hypothetical protein
MPILGAVASQNYPRNFNYINRPGDIGKITGLATLSDDSFYAVGQGYITDANKYVLSKYNKNGTVQWRKSLSGTSGQDSVGYKVVADSSNNVYSVGDYYNSGGSLRSLITKHNSDGTLQWQKVLDGMQSRLSAIAIDSSGNLYGTGIANLGAFQNIVVKYNSSGVLQWQRSLSHGDGTSGNGITVDTSGNVYVAGSGPFSQGHLVKYNSSGTLQWQVKSSNTLSSYACVKTNSAGDVFVGGYWGNGQWLLVKYNSSGVQQWIKGLNSAGYDFISDITLDSAGNIYATGTSAYTNAADLQIAKYNSSGDLQWQRRVRGIYENLSDRGQSVNIDIYGNLRVAGIFDYAGSSRAIVLQIPADGSKTGTYSVNGVDVIYETSSMTDSTPAVTSVTGTYTEGTPTLTDSASPLTAADATFDNYITYI